MAEEQPKPSVKMSMMRLVDEVFDDSADDDPDTIDDAVEAARRIFLLIQRFRRLRQG